MIKCVISLLFFVSVFTCLASTPDSAGTRYAGGMLYHSGYWDFPYKSNHMSGLISGLGGRIHFNLTPHHSIGGMGGNSNLKYDDFHSFYKLGYGGIVYEYKITQGRFRFSAGIIAGGCKSKNYHFMPGVEPDRLNGIYSESSGVFGSPLLSAEVFLNRRFSLVLLTDYFICSKGSDEYMLGGPRLH
ncbi:MAG: hypothetical protein ABIJ16_10340, partial [Bacteroidota bacterium]